MKNQSKICMVPGFFKMGFLQCYEHTEWINLFGGTKAECGDKSI